MKSLINNISGTEIRDIFFAKKSKKIKKSSNYNETANCSTFGFPKKFNDFYVTLNKPTGRYTHVH